MLDTIIYAELFFCQAIYKSYPIFSLNYKINSKRFYYHMQFILRALQFLRIIGFFLCTKQRSRSQISKINSDLFKQKKSLLYGYWLVPKKCRRLERKAQKISKNQNWKAGRVRGEVSAQNLSIKVAVATVFSWWPKN